MIFYKYFAVHCQNVLVWLIRFVGSEHIDLEIPIMPSSRSTHFEEYLTVM